MLIHNALCGQFRNISQTVTIAPRLEYSIELLSDVVSDLQSKRTKLGNSNLSSLKSGEYDYDILCQTVELERVLTYSLEALSQILQKTGSVSGVSDIAGALPFVIPALRTVSAQLYDIEPVCSQKLCELSVHLGSIVLDSATIATAKFDFGQSNSESVLFLNQVKLTVDSKISKQYHNLALLEQ